MDRTETMADLDTTNVMPLRPKSRAKDATAALRAKRARRKRKTALPTVTATVLSVAAGHAEKTNEIKPSVTVARHGAHAADVTAYAAKILDFMVRAIDQSCHDLAADEKLMALKPEFDEVFDEWWGRWEDSTQHSRAVEAELEQHHPELTQERRPDFDSPEFGPWLAARRAVEGSIGRRYPELSDEETEERAGKELDLTDEILSHRPVTRDGLALQCRALIMFGYDDSVRTRAFVSGVAGFLFLDLPQGLTEKRLALNDEDEENQEDEAT